MRKVTVLPKKMVTRCIRCVMDDSSDDTIRFDENGYCNYCTTALKEKKTGYFPNEEGKRRLTEMVARVKEAGKGKPYDCIMGISGGLDSSYLLYLGSKWGLRILAVHIDDGYDTEISKRNIEKLKASTGCDMVFIKPDEEQYNALTKAYMKAGVPNLAVPQDNILFAHLYDYAKKNHIKYFLSGANFALECILQRGNTHVAIDKVNLQDIHRKYGEKPIDRLKFLSRFDMIVGNRLYRIRTLTPLNYVDYNRDRAFEELKSFCGFEYYGAKHLENILTAFIQLYWFPKKFGVDKRSSHLSSMIVSGQMTREKALKIMEQPLYDEMMMDGYIDRIKQGMNLSDEEFEAIMNAPVHRHETFKTDFYHKVGAFVYSAFK